MSIDSANAGAPDKRRSHRLAGGLAIAVAALLVVVLIAVGAAAWVLAHLEHPDVKARWVAAVHDATGLDVDADSLSVSLAGRVALTGLRIAQPPPQRPFAPTLAVVEAFEAGVDIPALFKGRLRLDPITIRGVSLTVVTDASGRTSFDDLVPAAAPAPAPSGPPAAPTPRSRLLEVEGLDLEVTSFTLRDVHLAQILTRKGALDATRVVDGLSLDAAVRIAGGRLDATVDLSSPDDGTRLTIRQQNTAGPDASQTGARVRLRMSASVRESREARLTVEADLLDQSFDTRVPAASTGVRAEATATFDPAAGEIRAHLVRLDAIDGALTASGRATVPDATRDGVTAVVEEARVEARTDPIVEVLRAFVPAVKASGGTLSADVSGMALLDRAPGVAFRGPASVRLALAQGSFQREGLSAEGSGIEGRLDASLGPDDVLSSDLRLAAKALGARINTSQIDASGLAVEGHVGEVPLWNALSGSPIGQAHLTVAATSLDARTADATVTMVRPSATVDARRGADGRVGARLDVPVERLSVRLADGRGLGPVGPTRLTASTEDLSVIGDDPWAWTGSATLLAALPGVRVDVSARKPSDVMSWNVALDGVLPGAFAGLLPASARRMLEGSGPAVALKASGSASRGDGKGLPTVSATASADVTRLGVRTGGHRLIAPAIRIRLDLPGARPEPELTASLTLERAQLDGRTLPDRVVLAATSRGTSGGRSARVTLVADAGSGPTIPPVLDARLDAEWRRAPRRLEWTLHGVLRQAAGLRNSLPADLAARMAGIECDEVSLDGNGRLDGLQVGVAGLPSLPADPGRTLRGDAALALLLKGLKVTSGEIRVEVPEVGVTSRVDAREAEVEASLVLAQPSLAVKSGTHAFAASTIAAEARVRLPRDQGFRQATVSLTASVAEASQDLWAPYPVKGLALSARADVSPGVLRLEKLVLDHPGGGTRLELSADAEAASSGSAGAGDAGTTLRPRSLRIEGSLDQDLGAITGAPDMFHGKGRIRVPFRIESGNGNRLNVLASVESTDVSVDIPGAGFALVGARGRMPVSEEIEFTPDGRLSVVQGPSGSPWSRVRFHDMNPYLKGGWFATDRVTWGRVEAGPLAGNLRLDRTVLALDQMQATWQGGTVTGQVVVERGSDDTRAWFKGDVTGVEAGADGEGLDANAALRVSLRRLEVDGRVQLIRLGRRHLRSLLDLWDPTMENVSANRIRKVLAIGYPKSARVRLDGGFLSARVELGGIASVIRIDEIRGIPVGPLIRRFLGGMVPVAGGLP